MGGAQPGADVPPRWVTERKGASEVLCSTQQRPESGEESAGLRYNLAEDGPNYVNVVVLCERESASASTGQCIHDGLLH